MKKILTSAIMLLPVGLFAQDEYFTLPGDFQERAVATLIAVIGVILAVRVLPVLWKYLVQFFGKRSA